MSVHPPLSENIIKNKSKENLSEDQEADEEEEEEEENVRETYMSRRFSMKSLRWFNPVTTTTSEALPAPVVAPSPAPAPVVTEAMKREELLTKLLTQKLNSQFDEPPHPSPFSSPSSSLDLRLQRHSTPSNPSVTSRQKIIPAFSIPITFMLTHDSIKSRKSILSSREDAMAGIELPSLLPEPDRSYSDDGGTGGARERVSVMVPFSKSLSTRSALGFNQGEAGLLNMLTAVLKDDRELLMESDDDENDDDSSVEEEDEEVEVIEMNDGRRFHRDDL
jgi:hypothetical protein